MSSTVPVCSPILQKSPTRSVWSEISMIPQTTVHLDGKPATQMLKLMEDLEEHEPRQEAEQNETEQGVRESEGRIQGQPPPPPQIRSSAEEQPCRR